MYNREGIMWPAILCCYCCCWKGKKNDKKPIIEEKKAYLEESFLKCRPAEINMISLITKPHHMDIKEWIATHTISLFHNINLIYGTISEYCTAETCPLMQGPCQTQYVWVEERGKKLKCTAAQYIDYVMTFCQKSISNQKLFPTKYAHDFQENFWCEIKRIHRFLFNVLSHLYYAHSCLIQQMELHLHLNTVFNHFVLLARSFRLVHPRDLACLDDLSDAMGLPRDRLDGAAPTTAPAPVSVPTAASSANTESSAT